MTTATTSADSKPDTSIAFIVSLPAAPARVFRALTDPREMEVWVWGGIGRDPEAHVDLRPGGLYSVTVHVGEQPSWPRPRWTMQGVYVEVDPPKRLIYTVHWDAPVGYNQDQDKAAIDEVVIIDVVASQSSQSTDLHYRHMGVP